MKHQLTLILIFFSLLIHAQDFNITNFNIELEVNADGSYNVEEIIDVNFTKKKRGIYREIENTYKLDGGKMYLDIHDIKVQGFKSKVDKNRNRVKIRIGSPDIYVTGNQQYKISYKIKNGIISYPDHQEFHYDLTGNGWDAPIDYVDFTIKLPKSITLQASDFKVTGGRKGQNLEVAEIRQVNPTTIQGRTTRPLNRFNGVTAAIKLPKRYLEVASNTITYFKDEEQGDQEPSRPWLLTIPLAIFGYFLSIWRKLRKTDYVADDQEIRVFPPEGLTSAHVGAFVDQSSDTRDIVSLLPYWGGEGFIEMKKVGDEVYLYKMKNLPPEFPEYEHIIFDRLFADNEISKLSDLKTKFYTTLSKAQSLLTEEVKLQDYYSPEYSNIFRGPKLAIFPVTMIALGLLSILYFNVISLGLGFFAAGIGGIVLPLMKLPLTEKGAKLKAEIDAFKRFLKKPDNKMLEDVLNDNPSYFDKMFPFAVAFGLEKSFMNSMQPYMQSAPYWYYTDQQNNTFSNFSQGFQPEVIKSAFSSAPHNPSGGSGGSGGGFSSGSGVGGGGGGSW